MKETSAAVRSTFVNTLGDEQHPLRITAANYILWHDHRALKTVSTKNWILKLLWSAQTLACIVLVRFSNVRSTNQLVILSRDLGEPLVKLQDCYYSYQIPEEEEDKCRREKVTVAMKSFFLSLLSTISDSVVTLMVVFKLHWW